jgi:hypothetical protein
MCNRYTSLKTEGVIKVRTGRTRTMASNSKQVEEHKGGGRDVKELRMVT